MTAAHAAKLHHIDETWCGACRIEIEDIGPLHGPELPPRPGVERWSMTPEEWAGQDVPDAPE